MTSSTGTLCVLIRYRAHKEGAQPGIAGGGTAREIAAGETSDDKYRYMKPTPCRTFEILLVIERVYHNKDRLAELYGGGSWGVFLKLEVPYMLKTEGYLYLIVHASNFLVFHSHSVPVLLCGGFLQNKSL